MIERRLASFKEVTGSSNCDEGLELTGFGGGDAV